MGIYTNITESYNNVSTTDYKKYDININESMNFFTMGMEAIMECEMNRAAFDKAIALEELSAFEQTGSTDVLYEGISLKGIWEKIKAFFKAIGEKIKKIFAAFIGKMDIAFRGNEGFAKKYAPKLKANWEAAGKNWYNPSSQFKGFHYTHIPGTHGYSESDDVDFDKSPFLANNLLKYLHRDGTKIADDIADFIATDDSIKLLSSLEYGKDTYFKSGEDGSAEFKSGAKLTNGEAYGQRIQEIVSQIRKNLSNIRNESRATILRVEKDAVEPDNFSKTIYTYFRDGKEEKENLEWKSVTAMYQNSDALVKSISDFDKTKSIINNRMKKFETSIDKLINKVDNAAKEVAKSEGSTAKFNEALVSLGSVYKDIWGAYKEDQIAVFTGELQATKECVSQAKAIAVKIVGITSGKSNDEKKEDKDTKDKKDKNDNKSETKNESFGYNFINNVEIV